MYYMCFACTNETYSLNIRAEQQWSSTSVSLDKKLLVRVQSVFTLVKLLLLKCV